MGTAGRDWVVNRLHELEARLAGVRTPGESVPVVQSAAIDKAALNELERGMRRSSSVLNREIGELLSIAARIDPASTNQLEALNKKLTLLQLRADSLFTTYDLLQDATAVRSDAQSGRVLRGVDVLLREALRRPVPGYSPPYAVSYLDSSGRGGAIARARTRLPGGFVLGAALVRVSPESLPMRLSSILHEAGHQLGADLGMYPQAKALVRRTVLRVTGDRAAADLYSEWVGELIPDCFSIVLGGGAPAVDGLQRVLSLPEQLLYTIRPGAPHPTGPVRVRFADETSRLIYPDPVLDTLRQRFDDIYGTPAISTALRRKLQPLLKATPAVARALLTETFTGLGGKSLIECGERWFVHPARIRKMLPAVVAGNYTQLMRCPPLQGLALLGFARLLGGIPIDRLHRLSSRWLAGLADRDFRGAEADVTQPKPTHPSRVPLMRTM